MESNLKTGRRQVKPRSKMMADSWYFIAGLTFLGISWRLYGIGGAALFIIAWLLGQCFQIAAERRKQVIKGVKE